MKTTLLLTSYSLIMALCSPWSTHWTSGWCSASADSLKLPSPETLLDNLGLMPGSSHSVLTLSMVRMFRFRFGFILGDSNLFLDIEHST